MTVFLLVAFCGDDEVAALKPNRKRVSEIEVQSVKFSDNTLKQVVDISCHVDKVCENRVKLRVDMMAVYSRMPIIDIRREYEFNMEGGMLEWSKQSLPWIACLR